jgi:CRISPR-associated endonuclease/helicase Cas3
MTAEHDKFSLQFKALTGFNPLSWQRRLFGLFVKGDLPSSLDLPTGLGKTSVMAIWLIAQAHGAKLPRRLVYVVDRRAVVDQATEEADKLREALEGDAEHLTKLDGNYRRCAIQTAVKLKKQLCLGTRKLPISTLRGAYVDNREWLDDPTMPAIVVGTVDMIGSRLLFEGYGVSRKMRPYHAGLLGADALLVLDEAHLVPPFANLLRAIEGEASLRPKDRTPLPPFIVLPLSATQRGRPAEETATKSFGLEEEDWRDETASQRLNARKRLRVEPLAEKDQDRQLAEIAFALATEGPPARVVVFCNRREKKDDGTGPSAQGVAEAIANLAKEGEKAGREKFDVNAPELLVGARRVHEREQVIRNLQVLGFTGHAEPPEVPAFLVATSAGEVGVDLDADHMVCDLAPWERMVQRLGRVNRRGGDGRQAQVVVFDTSEIERDEGRKTVLKATRDLLRRIETDFSGKAGPAALLEMRDRGSRQEIDKASTPEPLHPALTRALVDAWSMTSLEHHTGRPEIAPWLRGWVAEKPQTIVVWRKYVPLHISESGQTTFSSRKEIDDFFDAAPPHESEKLETETYRVAEWLHVRANALLQLQKTENVEPAGSELPGDKADRLEAAARVREVQREDIVGLILSSSTEYERHLTLGHLAEDRKGRVRENFHEILAGKILIIDARFGGLATDGLLNGEADSDPLTADTSNGWSKTAKFRVRLATSDDHDSREEDWRFEDDFVRRFNGNGDPVEWLVVEHFKDVAQSEEGRSISWLQELAAHQSLAAQKMRNIVERVGLSDIATEALALAAFLHDEGKKSQRWQRAFRAPREKDHAGIYKVFAKTRGPIDQAILDGYRHEFGSLAIFELGNDWAKQLPAEVRKRIDNLPQDWRDLVLHLVAAHHGRARPVIETRGCEDAPPSALEARARDVVLRFARLQKQWGPWGLAWWEALLRAADQQASRDNGQEETFTAPNKEADVGASARPC